MEEKLEIPQSWEMAKLEEILIELESGKRPKGGVQGIDTGIPSIGAEHLNNDGGFKFGKIKYVPIEFAKSMTRGNIKLNDIIIVKDGATTGKVSYVGKNFPYEFAVINEHVFICRIYKAISPKLIFYHLWSQTGRKQILLDFRGAAQGGISSSFINKVKIPLPPLPEQHRIVEKIEALFSELDNGVEQLKTAQQQLKVYRQAVLKWAFEGKLTNENVKEGELPKGWKWLRMKDVCSKIQDGTHFSPSIQYREPAKGRYMYITSKNIREFRLKLDNIFFIDENVHKDIYARCNPEKGDVLLTKDGINTGMVAVNTIDEPFSLLSSVALLKPDKNKLLGKYLCYFIGSPIGDKFINNSMTGTAIKRIILEKTRLCEIPMTSLEEQHQIVQEIETRLSVCDKLEETITASLKQAEALRQSILKKAFEGKLVPQNPNDEPASVLLERIREEKGKRTSAVKSSSTKHRKE